MNAPHPTTPASEDSLRELGQHLVARLAALLKLGRSYRVGHPVLRKQVEAFLELAQPGLTSEHELLLVALGPELWLNGLRLPAQGSSERFQQQLVSELELRAVAGVHLLQGLTVEEFEIFLRFFLAPELHQGEGLRLECETNGARRALPEVTARAFEGRTSDSHEPRRRVRLNVREDAFTSLRERELAREAAARPEVQFATFDSAPAGLERPVVASSGAYAAALRNTHALMINTARHGGLELRHAKRAIEPIVAAAWNDEPIAAGLAQTESHDVHAYSHATRVCLVAVGIGRALGLERRDLANLGVAALLHDFGQGSVAPQIEHPIEHWNDTERAAAARHPVEGVKRIARSTPMNATAVCVMRVALEHHVAGGTGYPSLSAAWQPSALSGVVAIADAFVTLLAAHAESGRPITPSEALAMVLGGHAERFDPARCWGLVKTVGLYPPGQVVELDDGSIAVVVTPHPTDPARPGVRLLVGAGGVQLAAGEPGERVPLPAERSVRRALGAADHAALELEKPKAA